VIVGVPREIKPDEYRVALTTAGVTELVRRGHDVLIETTAGDGSAMSDDDYRAAGAAIVDVDTVWGESEMVLKVKEPLDGEYQRLSPGQVLFTYLHLAAAPELYEPLLEALVETGTALVPILAARAGVTAAGKRPRPGDTAAHIRTAVRERPVRVAMASPVSRPATTVAHHDGMSCRVITRMASVAHVASAVTTTKSSRRRRRSTHAAR